MRSSVFGPNSALQPIRRGAVMFLCGLTATSEDEARKRGADVFVHSRSQVPDLAMRVTHLFPTHAIDH